jgi:hypothetical protein
LWHVSFCLSNASVFAFHCTPYDLSCCCCQWHCQVIAEFKKANALIHPGPHTIPVWNSLYAEIEKVSNSLIWISASFTGFLTVMTT